MRYIILTIALLVASSAYSNGSNPINTNLASGTIAQKSWLLETLLNDEDFTSQSKRLLSEVSGLDERYSLEAGSYQIQWETYVTEFQFGDAASRTGH